MKKRIKQKASCFGGCFVKNKKKENLKQEENSVQEGLKPIIGLKRNYSEEVSCVLREINGLDNI